MKLLLTPRQRFELANLFYAVPIEGDVLVWTKTFNRSRLALGLTPIMDLLTAGKGVDPHALDGGSVSFPVQDAAVEFMLGKVFPQIKQAYQVVMFSGVIEALETYQLTKEQPPGQDGPDFASLTESWAMPVDVIERSVNELVKLAKAEKVSPQDLLSKVHTAIEASAAPKA